MKTLAAHLDGFQPKTALVLGSGLGGLSALVDVDLRIPYSEIEGFPESKVSGHTAELVCGSIGSHRVVILSGRVHYYESGNPAAMRKPISALNDVGVKRLILTNSAGSVNKDMAPGSVMQIKDHINFAGTSPLIGEPTDARFVGLTTAYDKGMRKTFRTIAEREEIEIHRGVYMWFGGPNFETPAEIKMARRMGADAVGMSTVPEVILARFFGMDVAAFSVITNFGAGMTGNELGHDETKEWAPVGGAKLARLIEATLKEGF